MVEFCSSLLSLIVAMLCPGFTIIARAGLFASIAYLRKLKGLTPPFCSRLPSSFNLSKGSLILVLVLLPYEDLLVADISDCDFLPILIGTGVMSSLKSSYFSSTTSTSLRCTPSILLASPKSHI